MSIFASTYLRCQKFTLPQFVYFLIMIACESIVRAEVFSSMSDMQRILKGEINAIATVDKYIEAETIRLRNLKSMVEKFERESAQWLQQLDEKIMENPTAAYLIIKRLASDWAKVENVMRRNWADAIIDIATKTNSKSRLLVPNQNDVEGAALGLIRLQDTYKIEARTFANGHFPNVPRLSPMSASNCFELGLAALNSNNSRQAVAWFQEALNRSTAEEPQPSVREEQILRYLAAAFYQQNHYSGAFLAAKKYLHLRPDDQDMAEKLSTFEKKMADAGQRGLINSATPIAGLQLDNTERMNLSNEDEIYTSLCRGENNQIRDDKSICYYKNDKPFLRLAPMKVEVISRNPTIFIFRSVISTAEVAVIMRLAAPSLERSEVKNGNTGLSASYRISKNTWLRDSIHPTVASISRRVADMTGLDMKYAERLQVANYGIGGYYETHHDCGLDYLSPQEQSETISSRYSKKLGNVRTIDHRLATTMFYLNQPASGGATVFPRLGVSLFPSAGDAVFWYNVYRNGTADPYLLHAACPVFTGTKWIMNRWISAKQQEFLYPCSLDKNE